MLAAYRAFIDYIVAAGQFEFVKPCDLVERLQGAALFV
jgi:ATP-dependent protease HslVU (ClpYQ) ATPase subunit